jgi:hypothetical protein
MNFMVGALKAFSHKALRCFYPWENLARMGGEKKAADGGHVPLPGFRPQALDQGTLCYQSPKTRWSFLRHQGIYCVLSKHKTIQGHERRGLENRKPTPDDLAVQPARLRPNIEATAISAEAKFW